MSNAATAFRAQCALHLPIRVQPWFQAPFVKSNADYYASAAEHSNGGWYPIGANQYWHNGIHFSTARRQLVQSVCSGRLVAARLVDDDAGDEYRFGSPSFVLVQHTLTLLKNAQVRAHNNWQRLWNDDVVFFVLYMNLCGRDHGEVPWLATYAPLLATGVPPGAQFRRINTTEDGPRRAPGLNARRGPTPGAPGVGPVVGLLPKGAVVQFLGGASGPYREVRAFGVPGVDVAWIHSGGSRLAAFPEFAEQVNALRQGKCAHLDWKVRAGEPIARSGSLERGVLFDTHGFHLELFSERNFVPDGTAPWEVLDDDTDDDAIAEIGKLLEQINKPTLGDRAKLLVGMSWDKPPFVTRGQLSAYYSGLDGAERERLRHLITRNTPFWAVDWKNAMSTAQNKAWRDAVEVSQDDVELATKYMWWRECEAAGVPLPKKDGGKRLVYHFHPLAALQFLDERLPRTPLFYVVRSGDTFVVDRPANLQAGDRVWVHETIGADWELGARETLQGCVGIGNYALSSPNLWELLMRDRARHPGVPAVIPAPPSLVASPAYEAFRRISFSDSDSRIWSSIWASEGGLDAINSYDSAFLSCGPVQQTAGKPDEPGELPGAFHYVAAHAPEAYRNHFGRHGLGTANVRLEHDKGLVGDFSLCDPPCDPPCGPTCANRTVLKGNGKDVLREFAWAYRFVKAIGDPEFRRPFLENAFGRLPILREIRHNAGGVAVRLGDICTSELVLALLLDLHINLPSPVTSAEPPCWIVAARTAFNQPTGPLPAGTPDQTVMAREIIEARNKSHMYDKLNRAAHIVLCVQGLNDALVQSLHMTAGLPAVPPPPPMPVDIDGLLDCTTDPAGSRARLGEMGGFLVHRG